MSQEEPLKFITTTLHHPQRIDAAMSVLYAHADISIAIEDVGEKLDVEVDQIMSEGKIDSDRLVRLIAETIVSNALSVPESLTNAALRIDLEQYFSTLMNDPCIIVERSPPDAVSLLKLLKGASGVVIGAYVGLQTGQGPLLFITVPAGMIIVGAASGIGAALEAGLRTKLAQWLTGRKPRARPAPRGSSSTPRTRSAGA